MKTYKITAVMADETEQWTETLRTRRDNLSEEEAVDYVNEVVSIFNSSLRPSETPRRLICIKSIEYSY